MWSILKDKYHHRKVSKHQETIKEVWKHMEQIEMKITKAEFKSQWQD